MISYDHPRETKSVITFLTRFIHSSWVGGGVWDKGRVGEGGKAELWGGVVMKDILNLKRRTSEPKSGPGVQTGV